ncbi:MAG: hypothetical protein MI976_22095 [Pseudomonadales bacterium]|nr:hypothetical protein [Pseudomonadales bacterium]
MDTIGLNEECFKFLSKYKRIIVTGPNRTGTTFFSNYLSQKLKYRLIDESLYKYDEDVFNWYFSKERVVVQGPGMSYRAHSLPDDYKDCCVVYMRRPLDEIERSSKRIRDPNRSLNHRWERFNRVVSRYKNDPVIGEMIYKYIPSLDNFEPTSSAKFRYAIWDDVQKTKCKNYLEVNYNDLEKLDSYVDQKYRVGFSPKQVNKAIWPVNMVIDNRVIRRFQQVLLFVKFKCIKLRMSI